MDLNEQRLMVLLFVLTVLIKYILNGGFKLNTNFIIVILVKFDYVNYMKYKIENLSYKMNKFWGFDLLYGEYS